ncbi:hypothetical protein [Azospira restricta]|uniref:Uncharacterized protein n=1 Tax=Azospira restricta TaxID=404405 RepID=A0A974SNN4_9RHOO|nr:hypothetical protein [Azospira restricta]QRJ63608.1 hypothetical protein IWH25_18015 [Azospira restricta]
MGAWAKALGTARSLVVKYSGVAPVPAGGFSAVLLLTLLGTYAYVVLANTDFALGHLRVNYAGGFVRRGFLGEVAFQLSPWVNPRAFLAATYHVLYVGSAYLTIQMLAASVSSRFLIILIFFCPAAFIFPVADTEALYRADIVAIAVFAFHARFPEINRSVLAALLLASMLTHELQLFFLPFHASLLILRQKSIWPLLPTVAVAPFVAMHTGESELIRRAICDSWRGIDCPQLLDWGIERSFQASLSTLQMAGIGYFFGLILALVPLAILVSRSQNWSPKHTSLALFSCTFGALLFLVGVDYGRWISLIVLHMTIFVACSGAAFRFFLPINVEEKIAIAFLYVFLWRLPHTSTDGILRGKLYVFLSNAPFTDVWHWVLLPLGTIPLILLAASLVKRRRAAR